MRPAPGQAAMLLSKPVAATVWGPAVASGLEHPQGLTDRRGIGFGRDRWHERSRRHACSQESQHRLSPRRRRVPQLLQERPKTRSERRAGPPEPAKRHGDQAARFAPASGRPLQVRVRGTHLAQVSSAVNVAHSRLPIQPFVEMSQSSFVWEMLAPHWAVRLSSATPADRHPPVCLRRMMLVEPSAYLRCFR
jgi:hypothetical protein